MHTPSESSDQLTGTTRASAFTAQWSAASCGGASGPSAGPERLCTGEKLTGALQGAIVTLFFAPMMAVLFIGARMRALQMDPINGAPQRWAQNCFYACTYAIMIQCILAIAVPLILGGSIK